MNEENSNKLIENIVNEYKNNNVSIKNLSKKYNISKEKLTNELKARNVPLGHEKRKIEMYKEFEKAIPTYLECKSLEKNLQNI